MRVEIVGRRWQKGWDKIAASEGGSFLQSFAWGEFKERLGKKVYRLAVFSTSSSLSRPFEGTTKILAIAQAIKEDIGLLGGFLYVPHGPVFRDSKNKEKIFNVLRKKFLEIAAGEGLFAVRLEPKTSLDFAPYLRHFRSSIQALYTLKLDLRPPLEKILASFKQKTRYNIRLADRRGVKVRIGGRKDLPIFLNLLKETARRDKFHIHPDDYYRQLYNLFEQKGMAELLVAEHEGKPLGLFFNLFFGKEATYLHGATTSKDRNLMFAYALMWATIKRAKEKGMERLDFWGVAPENEINHPWYGFTRFKRGFSPRESIIAYPGAYFLVVNPLLFRLYLWQKILRGRRI